MTSYQPGCAATRGTAPTLVQCYDAHTVFHQLNEAQALNRKGNAWCCITPEMPRLRNDIMIVAVDSITIVGIRYLFQPGRKWLPTTPQKTQSRHGGGPRQ